MQVGHDLMHEHDLAEPDASCKKKPQHAKRAYTAGAKQTRCVKAFRSIRHPIEPTILAKGGDASHQRRKCGAMAEPMAAVMAIASTYQTPQNGTAISEQYSE